MLKRQRPSSPVLPSSSSSNVPLVSDTPESDLITIEHWQQRRKRRRTAPPPMDGASRGWGSVVASTSTSHPRYAMGMRGTGADADEEEDDGEDEYYSDNLGGEDSGRASSYNQHEHEHELLTKHASEYESTNMMLRELHTLHQHRLLFSPPPSCGGLSNLNLNQNSNPTSPSHSNHTHNSTAHAYPNPGNTFFSNVNTPKVYSYLPQVQPPSTKHEGMPMPQNGDHRTSTSIQPHSLSHPHAPPSSASATASAFLMTNKGLSLNPQSNSSSVPISPSTPHQFHQFHQDQDKLVEESVLVSERYESTNRLIGSWFLSRRRALDPTDGHLSDT